MNTHFIIIILIVLLSNISPASESLFESAFDLDKTSNESILNLDSSNTNSSTQIYRLNGLLKNGIYMNKEINKTHNSYFTTFLEFEFDKGEFGRAYTNLKFNNSKDEDTYSLKEGFFDIYKENWDFRIGNQIIVWGRGDGINPTDNITPKDLTLYSPDEDDYRMSNFMLKANYNFYPFNIESIIVPDYKPSKFLLPYTYTDYENETGFALKFNYEYSKIDGSISYYHGYSETLGMVMKNNSIYLKPYSQDVIGWDFATTFGKYGFRNEFAYKSTENDKNIDYIPHSELNYVIGVDKDIFKDVSLILQYYIKYIVDYKESRTLIEKQNSIISSQTKEIQNSIIYRINWSLLHEALDLENLTKYNFDTRELFTRVNSKYDITDSFILTVGFDFYSGEEGTLTNLIEDKKSSVYSELKIEF